MTVLTARELLCLGSWKRALIVAVAVILTLTWVTAEALLGQEATATRTFSLGQAVNTALHQNRDVQAARLALQEADKQVTEAWSQVYPSVDFSASYTRNVSPSVNFLPAVFFNPQAGPDDFIKVQFGADNVWNSAINVEQPLFSGSAFIGVGAAGRYKDLQREMVRGITQNVVTQVRTAYYHLLLAQEQVRLTQNSVHRVQESLKETQAMNKAGLASDYDVLRLQVELANLEPNLRRSQNAVSQARREIAVQLALPDSESVAVEGSLAEMNLDSLDANSAANRGVLAYAGFDGEGAQEAREAVGMAEDQRSDLRQLELTQSLRKTEMRLEQIAYLPKITLFGSYIINAQNNGSPEFFGQPGLRAYSRNVGVRVTVPIFQGFRRNARIDEKRAALRQAETQTRLAEAQARAQVQTLVDQTDEALLRARGQKLAVGQAQRGFDIASAQYREGLSSQLELTDAEVALRQSEFNYAQAVYDYLVARAQLDQATGRVPGVDVDVPSAGASENQ
ncbi:MAG: TolC family protein [Gemmatimonadetes bacterium]|nr:TolC family protein [Gemmatimonadota bacterium]